GSRLAARARGHGVRARRKPSGERPRRKCGVEVECGVRRLDAAWMAAGSFHSTFDIRHSLFVILTLSSNNEYRMSNIECRSKRRRAIQAVSSHCSPKLKEI